MSKSSDGEAAAAERGQQRISGHSGTDPDGSVQSGSASGSGTPPLQPSPGEQVVDKDMKTLFFGNVVRVATEAEVAAIFSSYGKVGEVTLFRAYKRQKGCGRGCGLVTMESHEAALRAIEGLHGKYIMEGMKNRAMVVRWMDKELQQQRQAQQERAYAELRARSSSKASAALQAARMRQRVQSQAANMQMAAQGPYFQLQQAQAGHGAQNWAGLNHLAGLAAPMMPLQARDYAAAHHQAAMLQQHAAPWQQDYPGFAHGHPGPMNIPGMRPPAGPADGPLLAQLAEQLAYVRMLQSMSPPTAPGPLPSPLPSASAAPSADNLAALCSLINELSVYAPDQQQP